MRLHAPQIMIAIYAAMVAVGCTWISPALAGVTFIVGVVIAMAVYEP